MKILLTLAYDGTQYAGWQRQDNAMAVQEKLEDALSSLLQRNITVQGASRTDAGVHAMGQRATFTAPDLKIPLDKLPQVLTNLLPTDISVTKADIVPTVFNPRFGAKHKTYMYNFHNEPIQNPLLARYHTHIPQGLDVAAMVQAAPHFIGRHDFAAFCATGSSAKTTVREVYHCAITPNEKDIISLTITGNAFLYNMVRIIAGTLLYVGLGKIKGEDIPAIIQSLDRRKAGKTMPPQGLVLVEVVY